MANLTDRYTIAADLFSIGARLRDIGDGAPADAVERIAYELVRDTDG
jgi:hypothetical protein